MPDIVPETSFVGVDIGSSWIKAVEIKRGLGGFTVSKMARKQVEIPETDVPEERQKALFNSVNSLLKENGMASRNVVVGLPGYQVFVRKLRVPATTDDRLGKIILYEARQQIPFPIDKIQIDYHLKPIPDTNELEVLLVGSKKDIIAEQMNSYRKSGLKLKYLDVTPVALFNFQKCIDATLDQEATALINIGAATTDISFVREGLLSFTRTAPVGGNDLTREITKVFGCEFNKAEELKLKYGQAPLEFELDLGLDEPDSGAGSDKDYRKRVGQAITPALDRLINEIRRTFDYYISQPDGVAIGRVVLSGGTSLLPKLDEFLIEKLATPVVLINKFPDWQNIKNAPEQFGDEVSWYTTALGLALHSIPKIPNLIRVDFLPQDLKDIRNFKEKRLQIAVASAIMLVIIFTGSMFGTDEITQKEQKKNELKSEATKVGKGYQEYDRLIKEKDQMAKVFNDLDMVLGKKAYFLDLLSDLSRITPNDVWFTRLLASSEYVAPEEPQTQNTGFSIPFMGGNSDKTPEYKLIIEGKSLSDGSVKAFSDNLKNSKFVDKDSSGNPGFKVVYISAQTLDTKIDKTVTSFTFEVTLKPPLAAQPK